MIVQEKNCNDSQKKAISSAMTNEISLIQGPPGTGKTKTSALIVKYWIECGFYPILCVAETNDAVDNLCLKLIEEGLKEDVIRVGSSGKFSESLKEISLEDIYKKSFKTAKWAQEEILDSKKVERLLRDKKIIAVTCKAAGRESLNLCDKYAKNRKLFKAILVDEAAQVVEPTVVIPLSRSYCQRLCLVGDDMQLPPFVQLNEAEPLKESLFERLNKTKLFNRVMLNYQYRMHPMIAAFPNNKFYDGNLQDGVMASERPLIEGFKWPQGLPVCFVEVTSEKSEEFNKKNSKRNVDEADVLVKILCDILFNQGQDLEQKSIGVITPYDAQKNLIKTLFAEKKINIDVNTVDGFQGQERDLILVSTVRNRDCIDSVQNGTFIPKIIFEGFLNDQRRNNVLLTRSKRGLIVFGCEKTLSLDSMWKEWFVWLHKNNLIYTQTVTDVSSTKLSKVEKGSHGVQKRPFYYHRR